MQWCNFGWNNILSVHWRFVSVNWPKTVWSHVWQSWPLSWCDAQGWFLHLCHQATFKIILNSWEVCIPGISLRNLPRPWPAQLSDVGRRSTVSILWLTFILKLTKKGLNVTSVTCGSLRKVVWRSPMTVLSFALYTCGPRATMACKWGGLMKAIRSTSDRSFTIVPFPRDPPCEIRFNTKLQLYVYTCFCRYFMLHLKQKGKSILYIQWRLNILFNFV